MRPEGICRRVGCPDSASVYSGAQSRIVKRNRECTPENTEPDIEKVREFFTDVASSIKKSGVIDTPDIYSDKLCEADSQHAGDQRTYQTAQALALDVPSVVALPACAART